MTNFKRTNRCCEKRRIIVRIEREKNIDRMREDFEINQRKTIRLKPSVLDS